MAIVNMPALSPTMTEGKLAKWLVNEGDAVTSGDVIAEIETDKALMEVEALDDGIMASILVPEGSEAVAVGTPIAEILGEGENSALSAAPQKKEAPIAEEQAPIADASATPQAPVKSNLPKSLPADQSDTRLFASPLAKRIAGQKGIDLATVTGSGPHGRIIKADIDSLPDGYSGKTASSAPMVMSGQDIDGYQPQSDLIPVTSTRKVIATRLQQSMQDAPHFYLNMDIELDQLIAMRKSMNAALPDDQKISINDMIIKCAAATLIKVPEVNASWEGDHIRQWHHADIAVAVALEAGLVTPIVWGADMMSLSSVSAKMKDLVGKAQSGKLKLEEFSGGSFTISNLGMYGITSFTAVINPPHGAILAIGAGREVPVVKDGQVTVATVMTATLSGDHRVIDGAVGAKWMAAFKSYVENPVMALI
ncbi:MAG: pyruvate dehydrogenase complex dihydrolipoamide acetyltransferase [Candidatus Puniceispirillales bacterium]